MPVSGPPEQRSRLRTLGRPTEHSRKVLGAFSEGRVCIDVETAPVPTDIHGAAILSQLISAEERCGGEPHVAHDAIAIEEGVIRLIRIGASGPRLRQELQAQGFKRVV